MREGTRAKGDCPLNEWGFGGEIKSWWDAEFASHPEWGLSRCALEQTSEGSRERADLTVFDDADRPLLVLELRLPDHQNPSPYDMSNVQNASVKAQTQGARWSATSDAALLVLVDNSRPGQLITRATPHFTLDEAATRSTLDVPARRSAIRASWIALIAELAPVLRGDQLPAPVAPDEFFVESLRALLARPVASIRDAISTRKAEDTAFCERLIRWMVDQQGWSHSLSQFEEEISRVASLSAYVFTTRLLFYEALRRAQPELPAIDLPAAGSPIAAAAAVRAVLEEARRVSGDYDTVFSFDEICDYALIDTSAVLGWRRVLEHLGHFELDTIGYDVLGRLFERLIDPHERYQWGQHYTNPDVVDLMLSLAIPDGSGTIMDPALGGGTFLVRGYVRKQVLQPTQSHQERLQELAGCDQSAFAASIATVSLASRDLAFADNYPQVRASSFFQRFPGENFIDLPEHRLPGEPPSRRPVVLPPLSAVVCNPPYVSHSNLRPESDREAAGALVRATNAGPRVPSRLRYRYNYHLYFWFHGSTFLAPDGRLVFITSGEWLDSDYGVQLQRWLLDNTHIELVVESLAETWFTEARVGTVVLSARRRSTDEQPEQLKVRFVTLREPLRELYGCRHGESAADHIGHVDALRDRLLSLEGLAAETESLDYSVVTQAELAALGERLS